MVENFKKLNFILSTTKFFGGNFSMIVIYPYIYTTNTIKLYYYEIKFRRAIMLFAILL